MADRSTSPTTIDDQLAALLAKFPRLAVRPDRNDRHFTDDDEVRLVGSIALDGVELRGLPRLDGSYRIKVVVPGTFPASLPRVYAVENSIPKKYHTYSEGSLCLGAPLQLRSIVNKTPTLLGFFVGCVVPYLYRHRYIQAFEQAPWGELEHHSPGLLQYYERVLGTADARACIEFLRLGALRKRVANKRPCPCGSGVRLGRCHHLRLNRLRDECRRAGMRDAERELRLRLLDEAKRSGGPSESKSGRAAPEVPASVEEPPQPVESERQR